jgi:diguanylate cyclase (GGDEF)-like protein
VNAGAERGAPHCSIVTLRDVSERRRAADALHQQAWADALTGLANRASVMRLLETRCHAGDGQRFALLFLDLDGFKAVNDTLGHRAGDELLQQVARMLRERAGGATIGRLGGDEFVVVLEPGSGAPAAEQLAQAFLSEASRQVVVEDHWVVVSASVGIACFPEHGQTPEDLLLNADIAMYAAKEQGRSRYVVFHGDLDRGRQRRQHLQQLLRADADRDAFYFVVQSQYDARAQLVGGEMLIRWRTAAYGAVSPAEFIPLAEQIGVIDRIGRQALRTAAQAASILKFMDSAVTVAVNLSPRQLLLDDVERKLLDACASADIEPARLVLELTESALVSDAEKVGALLSRLAGHGFGLALDDFGTGYSSLSHLRQLPFHKVKIDRSFVQDLDTDARSVVMMEGIVRLCNSLGLGIVAEGIETRAQFERLREMGVQHYQGFWFNRPQPLASWIEQVAPGRRRHRAPDDATPAVIAPEALLT